MSFTEGSVIIDVDASTPGVTRVRTRSTRAISPARWPGSGSIQRCP